MSFQITTAFVQSYKTNIIMLAQQKGSRFRASVRNETQKSKADFYDRIGVVDAQEITNRHGDTPITSTPHSRRMVTLIDADFGDLIDELDRVRLLINPDDSYVKAAVNAMNRKTDDQIISAALGNAFGGETGTTSIALPNTQKLACFDGTTTTGVRFNIDILRAALQKFEGNEVDDDMAKFIAYTSKQKQDLLATTEIGSVDFNSVKALVGGTVDMFMGFKFIRSERLPRAAAATTYNVTTGVVGSGTGTLPAATSRRCFAWAEDGLVLATGADIMVRLSERDDKRFSTQVYVRQSVGSTRLEEEKVVEILCLEP